MYVRADYDGLFNFSMVNNIGALFAIQQGYNEILFWNSDLWIPDENALKVFFKNHIDVGSSFTGAKLLYPPEYQSFRKIEDDKRMCEKNSDFKEKFIKLSRDVHFLNDDRAKIKLEINNYTGSKIKEIKEGNSSFFNC